MFWVEAMKRTSTHPETFVKLCKLSVQSICVVSACNLTVQLKGFAGRMTFLRMRQAAIAIQSIVRCHLAR